MTGLEDTSASAGADTVAALDAVVEEEEEEGFVLAKYPLAISAFGCSFFKNLYASLRVYAHAVLLKKGEACRRHADTACPDLPQPMQLSFKECAGRGLVE